MGKNIQDQYNELAFYTLEHPDKAYFIHQLVVDAFMAQTADESTKPIGITFALVGLYLCLEKNYTGRQVQLAHMQLAKSKKIWPSINLPAERGKITVSDVLFAKSGEARDSMIKKWCASVWEAYKENHVTVKMLVKNELTDKE